MSFASLIKEENLPKVEATFNTLELYHLAEEALKEEPDNKVIYNYREQKFVELRTYYISKGVILKNRLDKEELDKWLDKYYNFRRRVW